MTYSVHSGVYEARAESFPTFDAALSVYRMRRAFQLTLERGNWFSVNLTNDSLVDDGNPSGLTGEQWELVLDDGPARALLNPAPANQYHNLVCGHGAADLGQSDGGIRTRKCKVCNHETKEYTPT